MATVKHTSSFEIHQPVKKLFHLFSAEGEKLWVPGWDYQNIMGHTELQEDYVFLTKNHDHAASEAIWVVKRYKPEESLIQLYKIEPGQKIGVIEVQCIEINDSLTSIKVTYEYIGLSSLGNEFISEFSAIKYNAFINEWKTLLEEYFKQK